MNIREPRDFDSVKAERYNSQRRHKLRKTTIAIACLLLASLLFSYGLYLRPLPKVEATPSLPALTTEKVALSWPTGAQAAVGVEGQGVLDETPNQKAVPTASVAKLMLVLAVLKKHPLQPNQSGPTITISQADAQLYNKYLAVGGSVVRVVQGQQITQYQALQAILLASANNLADTMAIWAYGSLDAYHQAANQLAQGLGMTQSTFSGDASGYLPATVSTPHDLVLLGQAAMQQPVLERIVAQPSAEFPGTGTILNTNVLLGNNGNIGIKTGNTEQAGGCYVFAAEHTLTSGKTITVIGAIMGAPSIGQAMSASIPLLKSFNQGFSQVVAIPKGTVVASYKLPWDQTTNVVTTEDATVLNWRGSKVQLSTRLRTLTAPLDSQAKIGTLSVQTAYGQANVPLAITNSVSAPAWRWRVIRR